MGANKSTSLILLFSFFAFSLDAQQFNGAWTRNTDSAVQYLTIIDNYFSVATFNVAERKFISTTGGTATISKGSMSGVIEFNSADKNAVRAAYNYPIKKRGKKLQLDIDGASVSWEQVDPGNGALSGNWKIIGREIDGKMNTIVPGLRKTIKILSASRFQWVALNSETGEFFGTGGGTYTFKDGKYIEQIEFFSRDASRVGASLSFTAELKDGDWHHTGLSSKGDRIYEIWTRK
jgi:hypothetical protein